MAEHMLFSSGGHGIHVSLDMFLDRARVMAAMDDKSNKAAALTGGWGRTYMQRQMRYRQGISKPGDFPSAHKANNAYLREKIRFGYDTGLRELIIGPALLDTTDKEVAAAGLTVPELINSGGVVRRHKVFDAKRQQIRRLRKSQRPKVWQYRKRPFVALTRPKVIEKLKENMEKIPFRKGA